MKIAEDNSRSAYPVDFQRTIRIGASGATFRPRVWLRDHRRLVQPTAAFDTYIKKHLTNLVFDESYQINLYGGRPVTLATLRTDTTYFNEAFDPGYLIKLIADEAERDEQMSTFSHEFPHYAYIGDGMWFVITWDRSRRRFVLDVVHEDHFTDVLPAKTHFFA